MNPEDILLAVWALRQFNDKKPQIFHLKMLQIGRNNVKMYLEFFPLYTLRFSDLSGRPGDRFGLYSWDPQMI